MDSAMKKGVVLIAVGMLSLTVAGSTLAGPLGRFPRAAAHPQQQRAFPRQGPEESEDSRDRDRPDRGDHSERGEHADKNAANAQQQVQHNEAPRNAEANREANRPPEPGPGGAQQMPQPSRPGARMSLEERQKLRRQINEAGRSLYTPPSPTGNK
jgi:hypothetical protein